MHTLTIKIENDIAAGAVIEFLESMKNRGVKVIHDNVDELIESIVAGCPDLAIIEATHTEPSRSFDEVLEEFLHEN